MTDLLEINGFATGYGKIEVVRDLSLKVREGSIVTVIGPNGAGKTTLFRMMVGQEKPDSGELRIGPTVQLAYVDQSRDALDGKKTVAQSIVYDALEGTRAKTGVDPVQTLKKALDNIRPALEVKSRRVGGATYQVPVEVKPGRANTLALRWLVTFSRQRREKTMTERLMNELLDASNGLGAAVKRREDTHKMAEANRAFAHYRW